MNETTLRSVLARTDKSFKHLVPISTYHRRRPSSSRYHRHHFISSTCFLLLLMWSQVTALRSTRSQPSSAPPPAASSSFDVNTIDTTIDSPDILHHHNRHQSLHNHPHSASPFSSPSSFVNSLDDASLPPPPPQTWSLSPGGSTVDQLSPPSSLPSTSSSSSTPLDSHLQNNQYSLPNSRQFFASTATSSSSSSSSSSSASSSSSPSSRTSRNSSPTSSRASSPSSRNRNSKLEKEFVQSDSANQPIESKMAEERADVAELRKPGQSKPSQSGQSPSGMDDIIGGLLQLMGGNLKMPPGQHPQSANKPPQIDSQKLANLISQFGGGSPGGHPPQLPFGSNYPRLPPQLQQMNRPGQSPNINLVKLQHQLAAAAAASANHHNGNQNRPQQPPFPMYQLPFIPLMGGGGGSGSATGSRPPSIPLNGLNSGSHNKYSGGLLPGLPPINGMTKAEMEQLYNQFISGSSQDKSNLLAEMMLSKFKHPSQQQQSHPHLPAPIYPPSKMATTPPVTSSIEPSFVTEPSSSSSSSSTAYIPAQPTEPITTAFFNHESQRPSRVSSGSLPSYSPSEPQIITMQEEPSIFEMVVKHKIGPSVGPPISAGIDELDPTKLVPKSSGGNNNDGRQSIKPTKTVQRYLTITSSRPSEPFPTTLVTTLAPQQDPVGVVAQIRNQHNKPQSANNNNYNNNNNNKSDTGIVYGKPATTNLHSSFSSTTSPSPTISGTAFNGHQSRVDGSHSSTKASHTATITAVGQPVVRPVQMDGVKPKVGMVRPATSHKQQIEPSKTMSDHGNSRNIVSSSHLPLGSGSSSLSSSNSGPVKKSHSKPRRPQFRPRPNVPIVRIDTCIVGDDSTCDVSLNEKCLTELGLSSCQCRPGFGRVVPRTACIPVSSLAISFRVDRMGSNKVQFTRALLNSNSEEYQYLEYESILALNSLFGATKSLDSDLMGVRINRFYSVGGKTIVNATISLRNNETGSAGSNPQVKRLLQQELTTAIAGFNNQLGDSQLWVESAGTALSRIDDLNECSSPEFNDCSKHAICYNEFGGFRCECEPGYEDKAESMMMTSTGSSSDMKHRTGRICTTCSPQYCSNRGECLIVRGERVCKCRANFIGTQCDIDVEVLGVAIGGSIAALIIIVITFICLYMWNQRFKQEQQKIEAMSAASGHTFSYVNKHHHLNQAPQSHPQPGPPTMSRMSIDERYGRSWANHHHNYNSDSQQHLLGATFSSNNTNSSSYYGVANQSADHQLASSQSPPTGTSGQNVYATPVRVIGGNGSHHHQHPHHQSSPVGSSGSGTSSGTSVYEPQQSQPIQQHRHSRHSSSHSTNTLGQQQQQQQPQHFGQTQSSSEWASQSGYRSGMRSLKSKSRNGTNTTTTSGQHQAYYPYHTMQKYPNGDGNFNETEFSTRELIYSPAHQLYATNSRPNLYY